MRVELDGSILQIDITALVELMSDEAKAVFYQQLAFQEKLLEACVDLLKGNTAFDDGYYSSTFGPGPVVDRIADRLKLRCLPLMDEASQLLIKNLKSDLETLSKAYEEIRNHAWRLEREWPRIAYEDGNPIAVIKLPEPPRMKA